MPGIQRPIKVDVMTAIASSPHVTVEVISSTAGLVEAVQSVSPLFEQTTRNLDWDQELTR